MLLAERHAVAAHVWLLALVALALYLPYLGSREIRSSEALYATVAAEMVRTGAFWKTTVHGDPVEAYPAYPWLVAGCQVLGLPKELSARLPALVSLLALAGLCGTVGRRRGGPLAGIVAASMVLCNPAALRTGIRAQSESLLALLLCAAWLTWYSVGQRRKRWFWAWAVALAFVVLATFTAGARAIAFFYLPFLFLRHPVKGRRRLLLPAHLVCLAGAAAIVAFWLHRVPEQIFLPWNELHTLPQVNSSYPVEILIFPIKCALYLMPWPLLAWPAFCMAYRPLEKSPVVFHFLRTIVVSGFLVTWVVPKMSPLLLLPVIGPLAIMTGLHSDLLLRRHHLQLRQFTRLMLGGGLVLAALGLVVGGLHLVGVVRFEGLGTGAVLAGGGVLLGVVLLALWAGRGPWRNLAPHLHLTVAFACVALPCLTLNALWYAWLGGENQLAGDVLAGRRAAPDFLVFRPPTGSSQEAAPGSPAGLPPPPGSAPTVTVAPALAPTPVTTAADPAPLPQYRPLAESTVYRQTRNYHLAVCYYLDRPVVRVNDPKVDIALPLPGPRQVLGAEATARGAAGEVSPAAGTSYRDAVYALCHEGPPVLPEVEWTALTPPLDLRRRKEARHEWFPGGHTVLRLYTEGAPGTADYQPDVVRMYRGVRR